MVAAALLLIFTGPWLVYLLVPVPDQLAEYRNYSMVAGFALLAGTVPWWPLGLWLLVYFAGTAHSHAFAFVDQLSFWRKAQANSSGDRSRATQEIGAFLKIGGKNEESEPYFKEAIRLNPVLAPAMENLANVYMMTGREPECHELVDTLVERCPKYASGWQTRGLLRERKSQDADAIVSYEKAIELGGDLPQSANHLGLIAYRQWRFEDALKWFKKAATNHPNEMIFQYNEAISLYALGRTAEAEAIKSKYAGMAIQWESGNDSAEFRSEDGVKRIEIPLKPCVICGKTVPRKSGMAPSIYAHYKTCGSPECQRKTTYAYKQVRSKEDFIKRPRYHPKKRKTAFEEWLVRRNAKAQ